jgi:hypothetical protein
VTEFDLCSNDLVFFFPDYDVDEEVDNDFEKAVSKHKTIMKQRVIGRDVGPCGDSKKDQKTKRH